MNELSLENVTLAPGVVETVVSLATLSVEGVASIGARPTSGLRSIFTHKPASHDVKITFNEKGDIEVELHISVFFGARLIVLVDAISDAVVDAVNGQLGMHVCDVAVYVDAIVKD